MDPLLDLRLPYRDYFTRRQALELGETDQTLNAALRAGTLVRLRHGVYAFAHRLVGLDDEERHLLLARAAVAQQRGTVALAGPTAALNRGFAVFGHDLRIVHLARLDGGSARRETGIVHHQVGAAVVDGITSEDGLLTVSPEDAVWQVALLSGLEGGVVTADSALHQLPALVGPLAQVVRRSGSHPHSRTARLSLRLARREAESPGESLTRMACYRHGIPAPTLQHKVVDSFGQLLGIADLYWEEARLLGEFDGRIKYERLRARRPLTSWPGRRPERTGCGPPGGGCRGSSGQRCSRARPRDGWPSSATSWSSRAASTSASQAESRARRTRRTGRAPVLPTRNCCCPRRIRRVK